MKAYRYVGPDDIREAATAASEGIVPAAHSVAAFDLLGQVVTFVVLAPVELRIAPRQSEHVACAGGRDVLAAGELTLSQVHDGTLSVTFANNQSTGYCPEPSSFAALAVSCERLGIAHADAYDEEFTFRRCGSCLATNVVKDDDYFCVVCDEALPLTWNFDGS